MKIVNSLKLLKLSLITLLFFVSINEVNGQYAYGISDIAYDNLTKKVTSISVTRLDYIAGIYYDPAVVGGMFQQGNLLGAYQNDGISNIFDAFVGIRTTFPSPPDTRFDVLSDHYVKAYYYVIVVVLDDEYPVPLRKYYDPLDLASYDGRYDPGWSSYKGSNVTESFYEVQYFRLGRTGKGITANPTVCSGANSNNTAPCPTPTPTPTPLNVIVTNNFKPNEDLGSSNEVYNALLGKVQLNADVVSGSTEGVTYEWTSDVDVGDQCNTGRICLANFTKPNSGNNTFYTLNLKVRRGNESPVNKSVKIRVSLPSVSFFAEERKPVVTTSTNPCVLGSSGIQFLMLGCINNIPYNNTTVDIAGFYAEAEVTPPSEFISDGTTSFVEVRQIIKPSFRRFGSNISQCFDFDAESQNGWYEDFNGREDSIDRVSIISRFRNNATGSDANPVLQVIDFPNSSLQNSSNGISLNEFIRKDEFETYITYFTGVSGEQNFGTKNRHALSKVEWKWEGMAKKRGSTWALNGTPYPNGYKSIPSESISFTENSTGEAVFGGRIRDQGAINGEFISCGARSPVNSTTKRNIAVWRKSNGVWYIVRPDGTMQAAQWGVDYDIPVPGDYDGDGLADFAVFRPDNPATPEDECANGCSWYILRSTDNVWQTPVFGLKNDKPAPADYDGDGTTDIGVFRPNDSTWHVINSRDGSYFTTQFGSSTDIPLPSDYDGDGVDDVAMWSPSTATWIVKNSSTQTITTQQWGTYSDIPVIGDYDGDGKTDFANWQSNGYWHILLSADGQIKTVNFGFPSTDVPVPGNYDDDNKTDIAVWRANGTQPAEWYIMRSSDNQMEVRFWGVTGDIPVPAAYSR